MGPRKRVSLERLVSRELRTQLAPSVSGNTDTIDVEMDGLTSELFQPALTKELVSQAPGTAEYCDTRTGTYLEMARTHEHPIGTDPAVFVRFENHKPTMETLTAAAATTAYDGPATPTASSPIITADTVSSTFSFSTVLAAQGALDAFDLDVDTVEPSDFASWFSSDWPATDFSTSW